MNEEFVAHLDGPQSKLAELADFSIRDADEDDLREFGFTDNSIETIHHVKNGEYQLVKVNGIGPTLAHRIHSYLGITTLEELADAAESGELTRVEGVGDGTAKHIQKSIQWVDEPRMSYEEAYGVVNEVHREIAHYFEDLNAVGSFRRHKDTIGDIDMVGIPRHRREVNNRFIEMVDYLIRCGNRKLTGRFMGTQVDVQLATGEEWPAAVQYFTGSQEHNIEMRSIAKEKGWKLNEYGLWDRETGDRIEVDSERELYEKIKGKYIPPEER